MRDGGSRDLLRILPAHDSRGGIAAVRVTPSTHCSLRIALDEVVPAAESTRTIYASPWTHRLWDTLMLPFPCVAAGRRR
jgi:hypothetical protein